MKNKILRSLMIVSLGVCMAATPVLASATTDETTESAD